MRTENRFVYLDSCPECGHSHPGGTCVLGDCSCIGEGPEEPYGAPGGWPSTIPAHLLPALMDRHAPITPDHFVYALRGLLRGETVPRWTDPHECLSALALSVVQTVRSAEDRAGRAEKTGTDDAAALARVRLALAAAGTHKNLPSEAIRDALRGEWA